MAKALKIVAAVAVVGALAIVTSGAALGLGFALSTTAFGVSAGALLAAGAVLSAGASLLSPRPKAPETSNSTADRLTVSVDLRTPRKIIFGRTAMATDLRDQEWAADQSYVDRFIVCASHRVNAIGEIWFDDKQAWTAAGGVTATYAGYLTVDIVLEGSAANAIYTSARMGSSRRFTGCAYVRLRYNLTGNSKKTDSPFASSIPTRVTIIGEGAFFYDPRLDSTVAGGAGPMRADDQATWAWSPTASRNAALAMLWYLLGWRINGKLAVGKGVPPARIDLGSFITAANLCGEPVATPAGGTEPRYCCDGIFSEGDDTGLVLDNLKAAMNAVLDDVDGKLRVTVLHNDLATPIGQITAADVIGEFSWDQTGALNDSINVIRGGYTDPSTNSLYQLVDAPDVRIDSPDGIDRAQTLNMPIVQSASQWQRLAKQRLQRSLYGGTLTAVFQATAWKYQKGDVIGLTFYPLGFTAKLFRIVDMTVQVDGTVPMMLREEHVDIYAAYDDASAAIVAAAPTTYDATLWPIIQGIIDAGTTANWDDIYDPNGTKPDDNATNSADPNSPFGVGGTVGEALVTLDKIAPMAALFPPIEARFPPIESDVSALQLASNEASVALGKLAAFDIRTDATQRQIDEDLGRLGEATLRALTETNWTRQTLRDAGFIVDQAARTVRIYALDQVADRTSAVEITLDAQKATITTKASVNYVNEQIAAAVLDPTQVADLNGIISRLTDAETAIDGLNASVVTKASVVEVGVVGGRVSVVEEDLDALTGVVTTKASQTTVDNLVIRTGAVEQTLLSQGDVSSLWVTVRQARLAADEGGEAALAAMVAGDTAIHRQVIAASEIRQELYTQVTDTSAEATARLTLIAQGLAGTDARALIETTARQDQDGVLAQNISALGVTTNQQAAAIATLSTASITAAGGLAGITTTIRQQARGAEDSNESILKALVAGDTTGRAISKQLVSLQTEFTTTLVANESSSAVARQALLARMGLAEAGLVTTNKVVADNNQSLTTRIVAGEAVYLDGVTGLAATRARLIQEESARATAVKAVSDRLVLTDAKVNDPTTGLAATYSSVGEKEQASAERDIALGQRITDTNATVYDPVTGVARTAARTTEEAQASAGRDTALGLRVDTISGQVNNPATGLPQTRADVGAVAQASAERDSALGSRINDVNATVYDPTTGVARTAARITEEANASATRDGALGIRIDTVTATVNDPATGLAKTRADVANEQQARIDADGVNASSITQVRARMDAAGGTGVTVEQAITASESRLGVLEGTYQVAVDVNGNITGFKLIGSASGPGSLNLVNTDLKMGTGRVVFNNGTYMKVQGTGFGVSSDLITWYGPTMAISSCTKANAISYESTTGDAYFGGALSAGSIKNAQQSTELTVTAQVLVGPFTTNGGAKTVIASYSYVKDVLINSSGAQSGAPTATLRLERQLASGTWALVQDFSVTGIRTFENYLGPGEPGSAHQDMSGSMTVTDKTTGTATFTYRLSIVSRTIATYNSTSQTVVNERQSLSVISTEG